MGICHLSSQLFGFILLLHIGVLHQLGRCFHLELKYFDAPQVPYSGEMRPQLRL